MKIRLWGAVSACAFMLCLFTNANAALVSRLGGQAVYDTDLDITWLADTNLAVSNTFGVANINVTGTMIWTVAQSWVAGMNAANYLGFSNWRLPTTLVPDPGCSMQQIAEGINCTGSEMGHLFYNEFGATANSSVLATGDPAQLAKFTNIQDQPGGYWSSTGGAANMAWVFVFGGGNQSRVNRDAFAFHAWAVRSGDVGVGAVPVPAAAWLMGSGLIGLLGVAKRKR